METYMFEETVKKGINTFITGVSRHDHFHEGEHSSARDLKLNLLGGTHYSTEKFACIALCEYFRKIGLPAEFIPDEPGMDDL
jgi:putative NIF3 family GTP cyclohydrolase 1 type 2